MKRKNFTTIFSITILFLTTQSSGLNAQIDSTAVAILDQMNYAVGNLQSCSLVLKIENDILDNRLGLVTHSDIANVYLKAPDKLFISKSGDRGNKEFYYDGKNFIYYSKDNNQYSSAPATPTIMQTIDSMNNTFGIDFPGSDFFYPDFVDEVLEFSNNLAYLGVTSVDNKQCYHLAGTTNAITYQIWIANDETFLPVRATIVYIDKVSNPQYTASYTQWNLNPILQNSMFDFTAPPNALKVRFANKK